MTTTAEKKPAKPAAAKWVPPAAAVGQRVLWHHGQSWKEAGADHKPSLAFVTEVCGGGRLRLAIVPVDSVTFTAPDDPVPHKDDPNAEKFIMGEPDAGVWEECPLDTLALDLRADLAEQAAEIAAQGQLILQLRDKLDAHFKGHAKAA